MKSKRRLILIGQVAIILLIGITIDKVIKVNTKTVFQDTIIPYTSSVETTAFKTKSSSTITTGYVARRAEDVWVEQDDKLFEEELNLGVTDLAQKVVNGESYKLERIVNIDKYDKKSIESEVDKLKSSKRIAEEKAIKAKNLITAANNQIVIKAFPHKTFKSYMPWTALSPKYAQGQLCAKAKPDPKTSIMVYEGRYLVALGFAYADHVGQKFDVVMEDGTIIPVMIGDFKATEHTDANQSTTVHDGSIIEFIVSSNKEAAKTVKHTGNYNTIFPGKVKEFRKIV